MDNKEFQIKVNLPDADLSETLTIQHTDETFQFKYKGDENAILNNGDNSWSLVSGELSQETVNSIGQAIEAYYRSQPL